MKRILRIGEHILARWRGGDWKSRKALALTVLLVVVGPAQMLLAGTGQKSGGKLTDGGISRAVDADLMIDPALPSDLIDVKTTAGIVTLSGSVDNLLSRERAVGIAKSIRGVRAVVDELKVMPVARSDSEIETNIGKAWARDPATDSYRVKVTVKDGVATLTGQVDSWQEKQLAQQVAEEVRGIRDIKNDVTWKWTPNRPDSEIQADIEGRIQSDVWLDRGLVTAEVKEGKVTLRGSVGSALEKSRAAADAWVVGVEQVDDSALKVDPWFRDEGQKVLRSQLMKSDAAIAKAVKDAFRYDPRILPVNPTVEVSDGVVTLSGVVENLKAKNAAERDARNTLGVWRVVNLVKVRTPNPPSDAELAKEIRQALGDSPFVDRYDVRVRVVNKRAFLSGTADSALEKIKAGELAAGVRGVVSVQNDLNILNHSYDHPFWNYYSYGYPFWGHYSYGDRAFMPRWLDRSVSSDGQIKQDIQGRLFWSPFVDSDKVTVTVKDGVATLRGTVNSAVERGAAVDSAYQGGALAVHDELKVKGEPTP